MDAAHGELGELTLAAFSERLASAEPVPGGGSASAIVGSFAASLLAMVARLSLDRPKYEDYRATNEHALELGERSRRLLLDLADQDARAYAEFARARKMARDTTEQQEARDAASRDAARGASEVPLAILRECVAVLEAVSALTGRSNLNAASDLETAARLAAAAARGAAANVLINLPMVDDQRFTGGMTAEVNSLLHEIDQMLPAVSEMIASGGLREPLSE